MPASSTRTCLSYLAALLLIAFSAAVVLEIANSGQAQAQSSVRPPANATNATGGTVPGMSRSSDSASEIWRAVRKGVRGTVSIPDKQAGQLVQSEGDNWRAFRNGPMSVYGAWAMLGMLILLALFFLVRGRVEIEYFGAGREELIESSARILRQTVTPGRVGPLGGISQFDAQLIVKRIGGKSRP